MTTVGISQPSYLGHCGFFSWIDACDVFVLDDRAQFTRRSWQCRNRIRGRDGNIVWLTIPTLSPHRRPLDEIRIDNAQAWQAKHWRSIEAAYGHAPNFHYVPHPRTEYHYLSDFTENLIGWLCDLLGIETELITASELGPLREGRLERLADMLYAVDATELLDTAGAKDVLGVDSLEGIPIRWHEYEPAPYKQGGQEWFPGLSVIDCLAWCGPDTLSVIRAGRIVNSAATP